VTARIRVLSSALADQIAAGEVVERPASVVKELVENALDAGATRIDVDIEDGGQRLIRVTDDGTGMSHEDATLSVQRHATSKIASLDDLFSIRTLGFRGEALPSIASVSHFTLTTRPRDASEGTRIRIDGGTPAPTEPCGAAPGTSVEVRDLFYNVPARLKFLKAKATEGAHVAAVCLRAVLAHPHVTLRLTRDGRTALELLRADSLDVRARAVFPDEPLTLHEGTFEGVSVQAWLGAPERARSGASHLHLVINGRPVRDTALARAVAYAYGSVLAPGRFPAGVVLLELDPGEVDFNVHPQKLEVKLRRGRNVLDALTRWLAKTLGTAAWSGVTRGASYWEQRLGNVLDASAPPAPSAASDAWGLGALPTHVAEAVSPWPARDATSTATSLIEPRGFFSALRPLGQAQRTFLICEGQDGLYVLDQHAADERIRFDRLRRAYAAREVKVQQLLFPERVECTDLEATLVETHGDALASMGLPATRLGPTTVAISGVPAILRRAVSPAQLLRDVWAELQRSGERAFSDAIDMALATMACHGSIRAGDALSPEEIGELLRALDAVGDFQGHCPHGRPVVTTLTWADLASRVGR
jgi:DNA mismatch repair protein MutL